MVWIDSEQEVASHGVDVVADKVDTNPSPI